MAKQYDEINLYDYYKIILKRKNTIIITVLVVTVLSFLYSYLSPKIYETKSVVRIPIIKSTSGDAKPEPIISISEAILMVQNLEKDVYFGSTAKQIVDIKVDEVDDKTLTNFQLIVQVKDNPKLTAEVSNKILRYFQNNELINHSLDREKSVLTKKLLEARKTLKESTKIKNNMVDLFKSNKIIGFNPIELQIDINTLENQKINLEKEIDALKGFEFFEKPSVSASHVESKPVLSTIIGFVVSLFLGFFVVLFIEWAEKLRKIGI